MAMFNRFTERARKVILLAKEEAKRFNHDYIGTEHLLLGLLAEGEGVAAQVLKNLNIDVERTRMEILKEFGSEQEAGEEPSAARRGATAVPTGAARRSGKRKENDRH